VVMTQAIAERDGAACAGGLDGLWLRTTSDAPWVAATRPAGPPANDISSLASDGDRLWVGTFDHGLAVYERGAWTPVTDRTIDHRINALHVDAKTHRVWVATAAGLSIIDGTTVTQLTKRDGLPGRSVLALTQLRDGRMLIGTTHGAAIIGSGRPIAIGMKQSLEVTNVWAVAEDADGWLWLGSTTGLYRGRADDDAWTRYSVATGHLRDDWVMALATRGGAVWAGTYKGGITRFDPAGADAVTATRLGDGWINPGGLTWIGDTLHASTMEGARTSDGSSETWTAVRELPGKDTTATARVGSTLWISTRRGLVSRAERAP
jgi:ligand-binding sensor domain-containing protein